MRFEEDSEYYDDYQNRDDELYSMSFDEYEEMRSIEDYGSDFQIDDDDDSYDSD